MNLNWRINCRSLQLGQNRQSRTVNTVNNRNVYFHLRLFLLTRRCIHPPPFRVWVRVRVRVRVRAVRSFLLTHCGHPPLLFFLELGNYCVLGLGLALTLGPLLFFLELSNKCVFLRLSSFVCFNLHEEGIFASTWTLYQAGVADPGFDSRIKNHLRNHIRDLPIMGVTNGLGKCHLGENHLGLHFA